MSTLYPIETMNNKYNIGETVYIARNGYVLKTTIEAVMTDPEGNNARYSYAGRVFKDGTAAPYEWENTVFATFKQAAKLAQEQRAWHQTHAPAILKRTLTIMFGVEPPASAPSL